MHIYFTNVLMYLLFLIAVSADAVQKDVDLDDNIGKKSTNAAAMGRLKPGSEQLVALETDLKNLASLGVCLDDSFKELLIWIFRGFAVISLLAVLHFVFIHE